MNDKRKIEAIELLLENKLTDVKIAKKVGISPRQFARWKKEDEFVKEWQRRATCYRNFIAREIERKLMKNVDIAVDTLVELMKGCDNAETKRKCAIEIIERMIGKVPDKIETTSMEENKDSDIISKLYHSDKDNEDSVDYEIGE